MSPKKRSATEADSKRVKKRVRIQGVVEDDKKEKKGKEKAEKEEEEEGEEEEEEEEEEQVEQVPKRSPKRKQAPRKVKQILVSDEENEEEEEGESEEYIAVLHPKLKPLAIEVDFTYITIYVTVTNISQYPFATVTFAPEGLKFNDSYWNSKLESLPALAEYNGDEIEKIINELSWIAGVCFSLHIKLLTYIGYLCRKDGPFGRRNLRRMKQRRVINYSLFKIIKILRYELHM
jgi:hypothetical protein